MSQLTKGSVTVWTMVLLAVFAGLLAAVLQFVTRQSHATILQEQTEQAFAAAEAGLHQVVWWLNSGTKEITDLSSEVIANQDVTNSEGETVATFSLTFSGASAASISVTAVGRDGGKPDICQVISARVVASPLGGYALSDWNHERAIDCASAAGAPVAGGGGHGIKRTSLTLEKNTPLVVNDNFTAQDSVHRYTLSGEINQQVQFKVESKDITPMLVLTNSAGEEIAYAGQEWQLAHVRYEAAVLALRENMTAFIGGGGSDDACQSSEYTACIPRDPAMSITLESGMYQLDITSVDENLGAYRLEITVY